MSRIEPAELEHRFNSAQTDDPFVLDIRPASAYRSTAIDGSYNAPVYNDLRRGDDDALAAHVSEIPADEDVVVVCKQGVVARRATSKLRSEGYEASTLAGGMSGWRGYQNDTLGYKLRSLLWKLR